MGKPNVRLNSAIEGGVNLDLLAEYAPRISVEHIPPYSPELNPIETCWKVTKNNVTKSQYFPTIDDMREALENFWQSHIFMQNFMRYLCR